ncbi:RNA 2',3'-cyclic phosphodiesterase [Actinotalea solisilvae]|uniref:RNA 2',3'-cyclic phosphodiesterase n=1 Tax=Actinotalea solisilvae TaxID=2072922 RepID=UPI0018F1FF57|nr:RNA 2',3'-cyclic phosphodiesterase [Actinotalea solisilvae]
MARLFVAVLPPPPVLEHVDRALVLARAGTAADEGQGPVRWTPAADRHLTLAFYGGVPDGLELEFVEALAGVAAVTPSFGLALRGSGLFDRRTLWIGCGGDVAAMTALTERTTAVGADLLGRTDDRVRHRAHLTVGRVRDQARRSASRRREAPGVVQVQTLAHALAVYSGPAWTVDAFHLLRSELGAGPGGAALHSVVETFALGAVAG